MENFVDDIKLGVRQRKKHTDPTCCPVCGITVRSHEIEQHYRLEIERLHKQSYRPRKSQTNKEQSSSLASAASSSLSMPGCSSTNSSSLSPPPGNSIDMTDGNDCWNTYQRIKNNRHARLKVKTRKRKADDPLCPVCNERIPDDIVAHVDVCLKRSEARTNGNGSDIDDNDDDDDSDNSVDVEAESSFDEYEWAGQTRIRASSLLEGGYQAIGFGTTIINKTNSNDNSHNNNDNNDDDDDEDLNVDGDDTQVFGAAQYTERDVILPLMSNNNKKETERLLYLRNLATGQNLNEITTNAETKNETCINESSTDVVENDDNNDKPSTSNWITDNTTNLTQKQQQQQQTLTNGDAGQKQIIESLKKKIREYELQIRNKSKCLICIDEFRIPVVSICCWHVHCEECWLRTLGARKLCPQCNMITSPSDLRRIYM